MGFGPDIWEVMLVFMIVGGGILVPIILITLLTIWLINKKKRDNQIIERMIGIKQTLDDIREEMNRDAGAR